MVMIRYRELRRMIELEGADYVREELGGILQEGKLHLGNVSLRQLAEATVMTRGGDICGREWVDGMNPNRGESISMEAEDALDTSLFSSLISQLVVNSVMKAATPEEFIYPKLQRVVPSKMVKEVIPGVTGITDQGDAEDIVEEGMPYGTVGFTDDYVETPLTRKRGRILAITKEALFYDRTGLIQKQANGLGYYLGRRREKNFCRLVAGLVNNFKWRGTTYNTYQASSPWVNVKSGNGIDVSTGWAKLDAAEQLFGAITDPNTGDPTPYTPKTILAMPARKQQWKRVLTATVLRGRGATSAASDEVEGPNVVEDYELLTSRWLYNEIVASGVSASDAADWWFFGDFQAAFGYIENWPITTVQAPANTEADFNQDIVWKSKTSMKGTDYVEDPRAVQKDYAA